MKTDVEKWIYLWISLLCAIMRDGCAVIPSEQSLRSIQKYRLRDLYALRTVSGRLKPNDPTLDILSELGLWHYRSRRMGQRCGKQIRAIGGPVTGTSAIQIGLGLCGLAGEYRLHAARMSTI